MTTENEELENKIKNLELQLSGKEKQIEELEAECEKLNKKEKEGE